MTLLSARFIRLYLTTDINQDGLPDDWELLHGLSLLGSVDADLDFDGDGFTNAEEFAMGTDPLVNPNAPPADHAPSAPINIRVLTDSDGGRLITWESTSDNESYFVIRDYHPDGSSTEIGRVGPGQTSIYIPARH